MYMRQVWIRNIHPIKQLWHRTTVPMPLCIFRCLDVIMRNVIQKILMIQTYSTNFSKHNIFKPFQTSSVVSVTRTRMDSSAIHREPAIRQAPGWSIYDTHHSHLMAILARVPSKTSVRDVSQKALPGFERLWSQTARHFEIRAATHNAENI